MVRDEQRLERPNGPGPALSGPGPTVSGPGPTSVSPGPTSDSLGPTQYFFFNCLIRSNFAVSATAITAMTPAWTGSVTTRSAASGTLPAMFSEITYIPSRLTSSTAVAISPPISDPASTSSFT